MTSQSHWESVHSGKLTDEVSWWQEPGELWTDLIDDLDLPADAPVIDVGAGSSMLVDSLVAAGHTDVTALDISSAALERTRARIGDQAHYLVADILDVDLPREYALWHDRAVFHFLTGTHDQQRYADVLHTACSGVAIVATFAPDGPDSCSGLPVARYTAEQIAGTLGMDLLHSDRRVHITPWGTEQPFTIAVMSQ